MLGRPAQSSITYSPIIAAWSEVPMPKRRTLACRRSSSSGLANSLKLTLPSSVMRPRMALAAASGVSWISLSMKCAKPPFWAWFTSQSTWMTLAFTAWPSSVETSAPSGVTAAISPSPRIRTFFV